MTNFEYLSIQQIADSKQYPFTLEAAVRKIGKRLFLRKDLFETWIESQGGQ
jgi:hypothetical protein